MNCDGFIMSIYHYSLQKNYHPPKGAFHDRSEWFKSSFLTYANFVNVFDQETLANLRDYKVPLTMVLITQ